MNVFTLTILITAVAIPVIMGTWHICRGIAEGVKSARRNKH